MRHLIAAVAALCLVACGGSQKNEGRSPQSEDDAAADEPVMSEEERILAAHQARQLEACEPMCTRLTDCAIADAEDNAPEVLEGVDVDALARRHAQECLASCETSELSARQVEVMEGCNDAGGTCEAFADCLDAVQPQPEQEQAPPS